MPESQVNLHIPPGINYECTGCGKCCGGWAVPLTDEDYDRIATVDWGARLDKLKTKEPFRALKPYEMVNVPYTHAIKHGDDGRCPFLVNNLCFIHSEEGSKFKPSICQLFPYCFNETPSGVYTTVSFISVGAVQNSGRALADQREYLEQKYADFQELFPNHHPNWTKLQLATGQPLTWDRYLEIEVHLLSIFQDQNRSLENRFIDCSSYLIGLTRGTIGIGNGENTETGSLSKPSGPQKLKHLDNVLITNLHRQYFPSKPVNKGEQDFSVGRFLYDASIRPMIGGLQIELPGHAYKLGGLDSILWNDSDPQINDLLYRYFYSRIFAKLYFGAGFGQLSLVGGFHHLAFLYALIRLHSKAIAKFRKASEVSYEDVVMSVREVEKRLGETSVGGYAAATLELLLFSPARLRRVLWTSS